MEFSGFVQLEDTIKLWLAVKDSDGQPVAPAASPSFRIYGPSGLLSSAGGTATPAHTGDITNATNASPIVITSVGHGLNTGQRLTQASIGGNTAANGTFIITKINNDTYSLNGSSGSGAYTSGGTFTVTGFYVAEIEATGANGFESGEHYACHFTWTIGGNGRVEVQGFGVT